MDNRGRKHTQSRLWTLAQKLTFFRQPGKIKHLTLPKRETVTGKSEKAPRISGAELFSIPCTKLCEKVCRYYSFRIHGGRLALGTRKNDRNAVVVYISFAVFTYHRLQFSSWASLTALYFVFALRRHFIPAVLKPVTAPCRASERHRRISSWIALAGRRGWSRSQGSSRRRLTGRCNRSLKRWWTAPGRKGGHTMIHHRGRQSIQDRCTAGLTGCSSRCSDRSRQNNICWRSGDHHYRPNDRVGICSPFPEKRESSSAMKK